MRGDGIRKKSLINDEEENEILSEEKMVVKQAGNNSGWERSSDLWDARVKASYEEKEKNYNDSQMDEGLG